MEKLRFAVTDVSGLEDLQRDYGRFKDALEEVLQTDIEFYPVDNFTAAAPALLQNQVDLVLGGPSEYVILNSRAKAVPVIGLSRPGYRAAITVRGDSNIKSLSQFQGKTIAMRSQGSTAGHLGPTKIFLDAGLKPNSDYKTIMLGDRGMEALKKGEVDACGLSTFYYENFLLSEGVSEQKYPLIATGPFLPSDVFVVNSQFNRDFARLMKEQMIEHQQKLKQALISSSQFLFHKFNKSKLISVKDTDYDMIREVYRALGKEELIR
ncbi:MAG: PhnD/SsuA/transferrin family substrate-binding protein [Prochloraceae cyanobacterium]|nr:PhnD/SsuA/transferrin family substrate-binding protein [Prochloraceae cyanobacterium]